MSRKARTAKSNSNSRLIGIDARTQLKKITPITPAQEEVFDAFYEDHLFLHGVAGTGKTYISLYLALDELMNKSSSYRDIQIIRSVVPTRDMGFLPGSEKQKLQPYETPYRTIVNELFE